VFLGGLKKEHRVAQFTYMNSCPKKTKSKNQECRDWILMMFYTCFKVVLRIERLVEIQVVNVLFVKTLDTIYNSLFLYLCGQSRGNLYLYVDNLVGTYIFMWTISWELISLCG